MSIPSGSRGELREATLNNAEALSEIGRATFAGTFQHLYSEENLRVFLDEFHSAEFYQRALSDSQTKIWVIDLDGRLVAYTKVGPNTLPCDPPQPDALELSRLYVRDEYQNEGLGARLMDRLLQHAQNEAYPDVVISVYSENFGGQRFYARYGFEKVGEYAFAVGDHRDQEFILSKTLSSGAG